MHTISSLPLYFLISCDIVKQHWRPAAVYACHCHVRALARVYVFMRESCEHWYGCGRLRVRYGCLRVCIVCRVGTGVCACVYICIRGCGCLRVCIVCRVGTGVCACVCICIRGCGCLRVRYGCLRVLYVLCVVLALVCVLACIYVYVDAGACVYVSIHACFVCCWWEGEGACTRICAEFVQNEAEERTFSQFFYLRITMTLELFTL